jgi:hypothetical protein
MVTSVSSNIVMSTFTKRLHSVPTDSSTAHYILLHKVKVKYSVKCTKDTDGEYNCSSTFSLTSALDRTVVNATHWPCYPWERDLVVTVQQAGWAPGPVRTDAESLAHTGIRYPDCPARRESLFRLSHPDPPSLLP